MRIRLTEPRLVPDLVRSLLRNGCVVERNDDTTCTVVHVDAADATEAETELRFFLRAWSARHRGSNAVLLD
jgi:hypothetical protein